MTAEEVAVERASRSSMKPNTSFLVWITDEDGAEHLVVAELVNPEAKEQESK